MTSSELDPPGRRDPNDRPPTPSASAKRAWSWKVAHPAANAELGLLYEPGNWGDVIKGTWAEHVARKLAASAARSDRPEVRYLDPFAGAPTYPLLESVVARLEWLGSGSFLDAQDPWLQEGRLASTGLLVRHAILAADVTASVSVFDIEDSRRNEWSKIDGVEVLDAASGIDLIRGAQADLILVDPYDFFVDWRPYITSVLDAARRALVLVYLYNKSPRGSGHHRNYLQLRDEIANADDVSVLVGRIPSDTILPRAYHEIILLGPEDFVTPLRAELSRMTRRLACKMGTTGAFEG
jgi:hypothetical protein